MNIPWKKILRLSSLLALTIMVFLFLGFRFFGQTKTTKQIPHEKEREVKVNLDAGFGTIFLSKGSTGNILDAEVEREEVNDINECVTYNVKDKIGYLDINTGCDEEKRYRHKGKKYSVNFSHSDSRTWRIQLTDAIPISFDLQLGLGKADIDFTDLVIKDLNLSTGASKVNVRFDHPNKNVIEDLNIEAGLSKFRADGLCNANFKHLKFQGGVGSYILDFSGSLDKEVDVDIEVGVGSLKIVLPENVGAKIFYEKNWFSHFSLERAEFSEREDDIYYSNNYKSAAGKMNIKIESGLGNVSITRN